MGAKPRVSNTSENIALSLSMLMLGIGVIGVALLLSGAPVPFYADAIMPGWATNMVIHGFAVFIGITGFWLYKVVGALFTARVAIEELLEQNRLLQQGAGVHNNVNEQ